MFQILNKGQFFFERKKKKNIYIYIGFHDSSIGKESTCKAGDHGLILGSGRSAAEGIGLPRGSAGKDL